MNVRTWLRESGHIEVADLIDEIILEWKVRGKGTRRNWWDILAGGKNGKPLTVAGREFPVLKAAQIRQGKPVTNNSIEEKIKVDVPEPQEQPRWLNRD